MESTGKLTLACCVLASAVVLAQNEAPRLPPAPANPPERSLQAPNDPGYQALTAKCKTPPPPPAARGGGGGGGRPGGGGGGQAQGPRDYTVTEIPGVIAAGQRWTFVWQEAGNNGDGIVGLDDGSLLLAQNDNSKVLKLTTDGKTSVAYSDTHTGGALSMSPKGALFIVQRGLRAGVSQIAPERKLLANSYQGDPIDCIGGVINDLTADSKGGVYFTMGPFGMARVFHISPSGMVTGYGDKLNTNGIILSADEKTLYVSNGTALAAFDVRPDGSLTNQREFAKLEGMGGGDGLAIDANGRIYVTANPGVHVIAPDGKYLGLIPTPRGIITAAFGGKDKKTLFILARGAKDAEGNEVANAAQVWTIPMIAQGYKGRAK